MVDIALCVCRLLLYNNFKRGVMSQINVCVMFRLLFWFRVWSDPCFDVASLSSVKYGVMLLEHFIQVSG